MNKKQWEHRGRVSRSVWERQGQLPEKASHEPKDEEFAKKEKYVLGRRFSWAKLQSRRELEGSRNLECFGFFCINVVGWSGDVPGTQPGRANV